MEEYTEEDIKELADMFHNAEKIVPQCLSINRFASCLTCNKLIPHNEPHIVAYKNGITVHFCRKHLRDAERYLDWFQELV